MHTLDFQFTIEDFLGFFKKLAMCVFVYIYILKINFNLIQNKAKCMHNYLLLPKQ
jgi:hypothetical protein